MINFENVDFRYDGAEEPVLSALTLRIPEGEMCLVIGPSGSGKTTLLRMINGLVPHFTGGTVSGTVSVADRSTAHHRPRDLADLVGFVGQDPFAGFVADTVEDELAYAMESLGVPTDIMRRRVEETLDLLGLTALRRRALRGLSGGEAQRVAIGAAMTAHPRVLVLDEPTSALDPSAAEDVLASLQRLVHDLGVTVVLAEHRLERVAQYADRVVLVPGGGRPVIVGTPADVLRDSALAPPVVALARTAGWSATPLSVREARRSAPQLREQLSASTDAETVATSRPERDHSSSAIELRDVRVGYGRREVLHGTSLTIDGGQVVALMGRNGAGKSTLLSAMAGLRTPFRGRVRIAGSDPAVLAPHDLVTTVGLVPQQAADLLYAESVDLECRQTDRDAQLAPGTTAAVLARIAPWVPKSAHPADLSEGSRLAVALSVVLAPDPMVLLLDEPTRGLDLSAKDLLIQVLREAAERGRTVVLATHDVELVAEVASRTIVVADGEIVADGTTRRIVTSSPMFAPQVSKVLAPLELLTVREVESVLARTLATSERDGKDQIS